MDLQKKLDDLFYKPCTKPVKDSNTTMALKTIQTQMNTYLKNKKGQKYERVDLFKEEKNNTELFNQRMDEEIISSNKKKKWKSLPIYIKWRYVH